MLELHSARPQAVPTEEPDPLVVERHGPSSLARAVRLVLLALLVLPAALSYPPYVREARIYEAAHPYAFHLLAWEVDQLTRRLSGLPAAMQPPPADSSIATAQDSSAVRVFFDAVARWRDATTARRSADEVADLRREWLALYPPAERAIERGLAALIVDEDLQASLLGRQLLLPPVNFVVTEPPRVLVVSPRDRIEVEQSVLLRPALSIGEAEALEREVDALGVSSLVVAIGGIATYPAIVPLHSTPYETLSAVAHEWLHGYLIFQPLGRAYFDSYQGRMLNESVAELAGRELGAALAEAYSLPVDRSAAQRTAQPEQSFDFRREMRATRATLDSLLADGRMAEAEAYLEQRRLLFVAAGYPIRKLNQAYFAFHGSYADSPAALTPLEEQVRRFRDQSASLGEFLRRVSQMTAPAQLEAALGGTPPTPGSGLTPAARAD